MEAIRKPRGNLLILGDRMEVAAASRAKSNTAKIRQSNTTTLQKDTQSTD